MLPLCLFINSPSPLHKHGHHCSTVGIVILRERDMLCQEHSHNNTQLLHFRGRGLNRVLNRAVKFNAV